MQLFIYDYNYSSWSMRAGLALRATGEAFTEISVNDEPGGLAAHRKISPTGRFPALRTGELVVWDSLAICEWLAERFPGPRLWPEEALARACARSLCAEMHSGFSALREHLPMNINAQYPGAYRRADVQHEIDRVQELLRDTLARFGGSGGCLFGGFSIADAFYAPVLMRFRTYDVELEGAIAAYAHHIFELDLVRDWCARAARQQFRRPDLALTR